MKQNTLNEAKRSKIDGKHNIAQYEGRYIRIIIIWVGYIKIQSKEEHNMGCPSFSALVNKMISLQDL